MAAYSWWMFEVYQAAHEAREYGTMDSRTTRASPLPLSPRPRSPIGLTAVNTAAMKPAVVRSCGTAMLAGAAGCSTFPIPSICFFEKG